MNKSAILLSALIILAISCTSDVLKVDLDVALQEAIENISRTGSIDYFILADETDYSNLPNQEPKNPITREKVELGRMLYFETGLGQGAVHDNCYETYSCSSCHVPERGFLPGRMQGIGDGALGFGDFGDLRVKQDGYEFDELDAQGTRPLSSLNVAYMTNTLWSGLFGANDVNEGTEEFWTGLAEVNHTGFTGLEAQNIEGFDLHRLEINDKVLDEYGYRAYFDKAFADYPVEERYTPETASFAISSFVRTLITTRAPFQDYLKGDRGALTDEQKKGALLFFGKANCTNCHNGPAFSAMKFYALGTSDMYQNGGVNTSADDPRNLGRGMFTGMEKDYYKFKVPQLYNLKDYTHFFHGSSKTSIEDVIEFKMKAVSENPRVDNDRLSVRFAPLDLTEEDKSHLIDFLRNALHDDQVQRFVPESVLSGNCYPNNDWLSKKHLGCD